MVDSTNRILHNFGAGPSILPREVFTEASSAILDFDGSGLSLLEIGHRTPLFEPVMLEARALLRELMDLDEHHQPLLMHGGASTQFMQVPMNLLPVNGSAAYTETGSWAGKAIKEAGLFGKVHIAGSGKAKNFTALPHQLDVPKDAAYLHITTNETIAGTQWQEIPSHPGIPLVADMSSDIMSRKLNFNDFGLIYAGAQKNLGAAGVNIVIVDQRLLGKTGRTIPTILDYQNHIKDASMINTPPVFAVYVVMLTLRWLKKEGGVIEMEKRNREKATLFYNTLDALPLYNAPIAKEDRSMMNAVFTIENKEIEKEFLDLCVREGMVGVKGHRSVGGFRVSMYNALPLESVVAITDLMKAFAEKKG